MLQTFQSEEARYNASLSVELLERQESLDPNKLRIIRYSKPHDICECREIHLGNQAGGFPFDCLGHHFRSVEHLYLMGEWSLPGDEYKVIHEDIQTCTSGWAAKRYKKPKYYRKIREDFKTFRHQWMLWCIWQKCLYNKDFREHLLSMPNDAIIVEVVPKDNVWAAYPNPQTGLLKVETQSARFSPSVVVALSNIPNHRLTLSCSTVQTSIFLGTEFSSDSQGFTLLTNGEVLPMRQEQTRIYKQ